ncbi:MAG: transcriptional repressor [Deltaproteobacteria bacterium]|nr:transcriptional repressor [Deltaproteobacteria bacterium]
MDAEVKLTSAGIQPSAQRLAVASFVLFTDTHPSAEQVWEKAQKILPMISRATVYNTLNLFVKKGILKELVLAEGRSVYDPKTGPHHHFIDESTGSIHDIPWESLDVRHVDELTGFDICEYQVVLKGRRHRSWKK